MPAQATRGPEPRANLSTTESAVVDAGQFLERMTTIALPDDVVLEALFHRGERPPAVVIAPGVPGGGGTMEGSVVTELTWALTRAGHSTLRFNFRGVGASSGNLDVPGLLDGDDRGLDAALVGMSRDLAAVIERQRENTDDGPVVVVGYEVGALVAMSCAEHARVDGLLLVSPPLMPWRGFHALLKRPRPPTTVFFAGDALRAAGSEEAPFPDDVGVVTIADADVRFARGLAALGRRVVEAIGDSRPVWIER